MGILEYRKLFCELMKINENEIITKSRKTTNVMYRKIYFILGRRLKFDTKLLGSSVQCSHSTVIHHTENISPKEASMVQYLYRKISPNLKKQIHINLKRMGFNSEIIVLTLDGITFRTRNNIEEVEVLVEKIKFMNNNQ